MALGTWLLAGLLILTWVGLQALGRPLPAESLVLVTLVAGWATRRVPDPVPTPVRKWPWRPTPGMLGYRGDIDEALGEQVPWLRGDDERR